MSELMKVQITGEFADISVRVPAAYVDGITEVIENLLSLLDSAAQGDEGRTYTVERSFPGRHPPDGRAQRRTLSGGSHPGAISR